MTITDNDLYRQSSQFRVWSFTHDELAARKRSCHQRAFDKVAQALTAKGFNGISPISFEQEQLIIAGYASKIPRIVDSFRMPSNVTATAVSYFRKFYLINSVMDYHPKQIMCTATFLAFKAENSFVQIGQFIDAIKIIDAKTVLDLEFHLLESLAFTLKVQNALSPLHGFFLDMQTIFGEMSQPEKDQLLKGQNVSELVGSLYDKARKIIISKFCTDVQFLYTPPQIALTALHAVAPEHTLAYIDLAMPHHKEFLVKTMTACQSDFEAWQNPTSEVEKAIDRQLHSCLYPERERERELKRKKRAESASATSTPEPTAKKLKSDNE